MSDAKRENSELMKVRELRKWYPIGGGGLFSRATGQVRAVDGVSLDIRRGETLGLVGESGCGKTTLGKVILRLEQPTSGSVVYEGCDLSKVGRSELRRLRRRMQIIFQDPYDSLDPRMAAGDIIAEPLEIHGMGRGAARQKRVAELLGVVGLSTSYARRFPHEFSGGQRQRIAIARSLALNPEFIVCDEPVSALDVSIQSQILNLLSDLKREFNLTYLFIAHGMGVVKHISDRVGVMYLGKLVELADKHELYVNHRHPYTEALMSAIPIPDPAIRRNRIILEGDVPSPINPPSGCRFHTRCWRAWGLCREREPELLDVGGGHLVACHLWPGNGHASARTEA